MTEREIFTAALAREDRAERAAFLDEACAGGAALRERVESLLAEHQQLGSFMDVPSQAVAKTVEMPGAPLVAERAGTIIGPYKLLQQIGEGGMGVVFMAEQAAPVRRKVALKIIKPGMDTREVIARFEAERQALALMDHPNIARVFDGGATDAGRPYFVMELVRGVPITDYCDQNNLPVHERLELFVTVCHAVQHAHQKGIIHRDIKPSNVLVTMHDGRPIPKVIDFGVAKAIGQQLTDKTLFTQFAQMVGTPLYMSPEQAQLTGLDVDTRGDIYSLGVLLYELLTGTTPFERGRIKQAALEEIRRMIREEEPPSPSTRLSSTAGETQTAVAAHRRVDPRGLSRLVRGDLDWIVMKALEKDRNRRYETANGFAADIGRYLSDEPVEACPPSAAYRFRKFARRNKRALAGAALLGLALFVAVGAVAGSFGWVVRDRNARRVKTAGEVEQFLKQADSLYEDNKLPEALAEVQKAQGLLEAGGGDETLRQQVRQWRADLDTAIRLEELRLDSTDQLDREQIYAEHARAFRDYGIDLQVLPTEEAVARVAASRIKLDLVLTLTNWANYLQYDPQPQGPAGWERLLSISRAADPDPARLRLLAAAEAKDLPALREMAEAADLARVRTRTLAFLGNSLNTAGDRDAAIAFLRKAQRQHPGDFSINSTLASCLTKMNVPSLDRVVARSDEVVGFRRAAVAIRPRSARAHFDLGRALSRNGDLDLAIRLKPDSPGAHNNLGNARADKVLPDEAIAEYHATTALDWMLAVGRYNLGKALRTKGRMDEAIAEYREAIRLKPDSPACHDVLGSALFSQNQLDEAIAEYRKAIELDPKSGARHFNLGCALECKGVLDEAIVEYREASRLKPGNPLLCTNLGYTFGRRGLQDESISAFREGVRLAPSDPTMHTNLGSALYAKSMWDEAIVEYREAIRLKPENAIPHHNLGLALAAKGVPDDAIAEAREAIRLKPDYADAHSHLGFALSHKGLPDEAIASCRTAIELGPNNANAHYVLGIVLSAQGKLDEAIGSFRKAIELKPKLISAYITLGIALRGQKKLDEAVSAFREAVDLDPKDAAAHNNLGNALWDMGKLDEAIACYREAIKLDPNDVDARNKLGRFLGENGWQLAENPNAQLRDPKRAVELAEEAVELVPQSVYAWQYLGWIQYRARNWKGSIVALDESCKLEKGGDAGQWIVLSLAHRKLANEEDLADEERTQHQVEARRLYGEAAKQINNWGPGGGSVLQAIRDFRAEAAELLGVNQAIQSLEMLVAAQPDAWEPRVKLAQAYAEEGLWEEATAEYTKATEVKPDAWEPWSRRAFFHFGRQQWDGAIADFSRAIDLAPQVHTNWWHRGHAYLQLAQWDKAAADFGKVVEQWPEGGEGWYLRGVAFAQLKQPDKALADLRQAIAKGFEHMEWLGSDSRLDPLRTNDDFDKLRTLLEKKEK